MSNQTVIKQYENRFEGQSWTKSRVSYCSLAPLPLCWLPPGSYKTFINYYKIKGDGFIN